MPARSMATRAMTSRCLSRAEPRSRRCFRASCASGGFGGAEGLATTSPRSASKLLIDATHPFAVQMKAQRHGGLHVLAACLCSPFAARPGNPLRERSMDHGGQLSRRGGRARGHAAPRLSHHRTMALPRFPAGTAASLSRAQRRCALARGSAAAHGADHRARAVQGGGRRGPCSRPMRSTWSSPRTPAVRRPLPSSTPRVALSLPVIMVERPALPDVPRSRPLQTRLPGLSALMARRAPRDAACRQRPGGRPWRSAWSRSTL